jgi:Transposase DDE domain
MDTQLIQLYLLACELYDRRRRTCFQRLSNNAHPDGITDQEVVTIYWFGHLHGYFEKKAMHHFIQNYWSAFFPKLPSYQTFVARLNRLEATFQSLGAELQARLAAEHVRGVDQVIDSLPVMLARGGHAYTARVARAVADVGYCASKKIYFHGVRLHTLAERRSGQLPRPRQIWLREGSCADVRSLKEQELELPATTLFGDKAYRDAALAAQLAGQETSLHTPRKKPKGQALSAIEKHYNRCVSRLRQPIESLFNWFNDKTDLQNASTVRSEEALMIHCFGKLTVVYLLLVFNP